MSNDDYDSSFIAEALPAFVSEAHEHIEMLEQLLLQLEDAPGDRELLDALFRCAHTIKGSAGIFGLDHIVAFTHHVETLLDQLRAGRRALTPALSTLLLKCNDQIRTLVGCRQTPHDEGARCGTGTRRPGEQLRSGCADSGAARRCDARGAGDAAPTAPAATRRWQLSVRFGTDTFRNGMDPLAILNYLGGIGAIADLTCDAAAVPELDAVDPRKLPPGFSSAWTPCLTRGDRGRLQLRARRLHAALIEPGR